MRLLMILAIIHFGRGTSAQSCNNAPLLGCHLDHTPCNHGAGTCKDCCRSELGEVEMSSYECTGDCKCCGVPDNNCPSPLCGCGTGYTTETAIDPISHCTKCFCVPETCSPPPPCGCAPPYLTEYYQISSTGCLSCDCVVGCPAIDCPICKSYERLVHGTNDRGCSTCTCVPQCPAIECPICEIYERLVHGTNDRGCSTCTCECIEGSGWRDDCNTCTCLSNGVSSCTEKACLPERCLPTQCPVCKTNEKQVARIDIFGCPICICEQCPQVGCPIYCPTNQQLVYGEEDGCPICTCGQCPASICGCSPNDEEIEVLLPSGCKSCQCVPNQGSLCPEVQCPICNGGQNELHGVGGDGCPFCICGGGCIEGSTWKQDCNTCTCNNGVVACTEIGCLPAPCPIAVCPQCFQGQSPVYTEDLATGCVTCSCSQAERCVEGSSKPHADGCNTCTCVNGAYACTIIDCSPLVCPEVDCPICSTDEKQALGSEDGCPVCYCEPCPLPLCVCSDGLTPVLEYHETDCPTCGCVPVQPEPCIPALCGCAPGFVTVDTVQSNGCPGCDCVPDTVCPEVDCPICSTDEKQAIGTSEDGCRVCSCESCPLPLCVCTNGLTPVLEYHETDCPTCGCVSVQPEPCIPAICGCAPGFETVDTVQSNGCPGCACVPKPEPCPQPLCVCTGGLIPILQYHENDCPTCGCVQPVEPVACPGGFCKSNCDFEAGEYVGPFATCPARQFCCNSPVTAPCANNGESCGALCTCRTVCEQGEYEDGLCSTNLQDVGQCSKCKTCADDPVCLFGCQGDQVMKAERSSNGCIECQCLCPPLDNCSPSCTRSLDETTGCFKCNC